jgi:hypothetical protein
VTGMELCSVGKGVDSLENHMVEEGALGDLDEHIQ